MKIDVKISVTELAPLLKEALEKYAGHELASVEVTSYRKTIFSINFETEMVNCIDEVHHSFKA